MAKTLYQKLWDSHLVKELDGGASLLYIDRQLLHEVTSPQAFETLRERGSKPWRINANVATTDHSIPTTNQALGVEAIEDPIAKIQVQQLDINCAEFGITEFGMNHPYQGIVHIIGPELGFTLPGMTIVCGDSHTSTHGALAALAQGVGTSQVEHVLATQCLVQKKHQDMRAIFNGTLQPGVFAKDCILALIGKIGIAGATGYALEYAGPAIESMSIEGRMTLCNMSIEAGARVGLVAFDKITQEYVQNARFAPKGKQLDQALEYWKTLRSDKNATFNKEVHIDCDQLAPQVSWGTSPEMVTNVNGIVPNPDDIADPGKRASCISALDYMGLAPEQAIQSIPVDRVFIGSCTNARIEDIRAAANIIKGRKINKKIKQALVVPGSGSVKRQAEQEGLHELFLEAGFEWREPGCSMCLAMNNDKLPASEHCAATSNRNFEGRQGTGGRTHLVSPAMASAAALAGHFVDIRSEYSNNESI